MITNTKIRFATNQPLLQKLADTAEKRCLENIRDFGGRRVLVEGGGYEKIWLETQPMGGEMYAVRDMTAGRNNQLLFMEHIRPDGRLPGSIALLDGVVTPQYDKLQGFCFPAPALNLYYLMGGQDGDYLELLYDTLERFDAYLWRTRDSDGDGCLESWCRYDTGEDHAERYGDAPNAWEAETPPEDCKTVPMASIDVMSYSFACRETLAKISRIRKKEDCAKEWNRKARQVQERIAFWLWNEEAGACLDRDRQHQVMPVLTHNTLRAMYWNSITPYMAGRFVREHLLNPAEFWTGMPLPSVAVNDPLFRNVSTNNWSGQVEALTYQRAIRALENYGYDGLIPMLGQKLFEAVGEDCHFVQQYDPFTGAPSLAEERAKQGTYGPALLGVLEYIARMYGVHMEGDRLYWGGAPGIECVYEMQWGEECFRVENSGSRVVGYVNGRKIFGVDAGRKVVTKLSGQIKEVRNYESCQGQM